MGSGGEGQGGEEARGEPQLDLTLQHPRCVYQILKRHFAAYTPEKVEEICGIPQELFLKVCRLFVENSGRERTTAFVHGVGWTQHTIGSQYIRCASILQLLLGNMGRPGGGVMAMRGHASIQGSSDIPTLFDTLPGYIPMPHAHQPEGLEAFLAGDAPKRGFWGNMSDYTVSLLKAWWGQAATAENDYLLRLPAAADRQPFDLRHRHGADQGHGQGLHPVRAEPGRRLRQLADAAPGHVQARLAGRARLLADRVGHLVEGRPGDRVR